MSCGAAVVGRGFKVGVTQQVQQHLYLNAVGLIRGMMHIETVPPPSCVLMESIEVDVFTTHLNYVPPYIQMVLLYEFCKLRNLTFCILWQHLTVITLIIYS